VKTCTDCGDSKSYDSFHRSKTAIDGRMSVCKVCRHKAPSMQVQSLLRKIETLERRLSVVDNDRNEERKKWQARLDEERERREVRAELLRPRLELIALMCDQAIEKLEAIKKATTVKKLEDLA